MHEIRGRMHPIAKGTPQHPNHRDNLREILIDREAGTSYSRGGRGVSDRERGEPPHYRKVDGGAPYYL